MFSKKKGRKAKGVSFKQDLTTIDLSGKQMAKRKKKDSVYMDQGGKHGGNTIKRQQFEKKKNRKSIFGMHDTSKPIAQRKKSRFEQNAFAETFKLNEEQMALLQNQDLIELIQTEIEEFGIVSCDKKEATLKMILSAAGSREEVVKMIEARLGVLGDDSICELTDEKYKELVFPLTDSQLKQVTNPHHLKMLTDDMVHFGNIGVDEGILKLKIPDKLPTITPIHQLEKRLGVLTTIEEIKQIRDNIRGEEKENVEQNINVDEIEVLKLNDKDFFNQMMNAVDNGVKFIKHKKRGIFDERFVLIHNDRLYWKEKAEERNHRSRSMHLTKIIQVMIGKNTKALKHEQLEDIAPVCCFSVVAKKATLDLSTPTLNPIEVRKFTAYLKGLQRHFISQQSQFMSQTPHNRSSGKKKDHHHRKSQKEKPAVAKQQRLKLSPIGTGFGGYKFDEESVAKLSV